jgi:hypothetical protein
MPSGRTYRFVETPTGRTSSSREFQRTVRSHAASVSHPDHITRRQPRSRRQDSRGGPGVFVFELNPPPPLELRNVPLPPAAAPGDEPTTTGIGSLPDGSRQPLSPNTLLRPFRLSTDPLSGDTFSPIQQLTIYHKPYLPGIINHYIYNLTIPIPELDGNSMEPLFRAAWLPVVFHDPVVFQVVILFAATHYATFADTTQFNQLYLELLSLKQSALLALIQTVQGQQNTSPTSISQTRASRDTLIAAAAKMASYEAIFGAREAVRQLQAPSLLPPDHRNTNSNLPPVPPPHVHRHAPAPSRRRP